MPAVQGVAERKSFAASGRRVSGKGSGRTESPRAERTGVAQDVDSLRGGRVAASSPRHIALSGRCCPLSLPSHHPAAGSSSAPRRSPYRRDPARRRFPERKQRETATDRPRRTAGAAAAHCGASGTGGRGFRHFPQTVRHTKPGPYGASGALITRGTGDFWRGAGPPPGLAALRARLDVKSNALVQTGVFPSLLLGIFRDLPRPIAPRSP